MENSQKLDAQYIKIDLKEKYGERIEIRHGNSIHYSFNIKDKIKIADIVVYLNFEKQTAILWNNKNRRENGAISHCFSFHKIIDEGFVSEGMIAILSGKYRTKSGLKNEKILVMSFETLYENTDHLYEVVCLDDDIDIQEMGNHDDKNKLIRERSLVSRWNRKSIFRKKVLEAYRYRCFICGCKEEKLLEAAHIIPVSANGTDDVENGICLCANHHRMFDKRLIKIDCKNMRLTYIADSVRHMPCIEYYMTRLSD